MRAAPAGIAACMLSFLVACDDSSSSSATTSTGEPVVAERCLVRLHPKGGSGADPEMNGDVAIISPTGNAEGWGGRQWLYFPDDEYEAARAIVADSTEACQTIILNGFSNGAAFAAKLYCRGETFDGRVTRIVIDDPVVDAAVDGCAPDPSVTATLYWTGALDDPAQPGWDCSEQDWTCEGGTTIGIDAYAEQLRIEIQDSPLDDHAWYQDAPELTQF